MDTSSIVVVVGGLCCIGLIVLVVVVAVRAIRRERARQDALGSWAAYHGWQVAQRPAVDWGRRMPGRDRRGVTLALSGAIGGRPVAIAEYRYTSTSTSTSSAGSTSPSSSTTYHYVLMMVWLSRPGPAVAVLRRGAVSRLGRSLFGDRATAIGYEPFDNAYRVVADDPGPARSVLRPELVAEHVAGSLPEWSLRGNELLAFRSGTIGDPNSIPVQLAPLLRVADLLDPLIRR